MNTGPGQHIRPAGEETTAGELLIPAGTLLNPAHLALAAVAGHDKLQVQRKPRVAVVLTGSEMVTSGEPAPGQVRDAFGPQLEHVISQSGGRPRTARYGSATPTESGWRHSAASGAGRGRAGRRP